MPAVLGTAFANAVGDLLQKLPDMGLGGNVGNAVVPAARQAAAVSFTGTGAVAEAPEQYRQAVADAAAQWAVPKELLTQLIRAESSFRSDIPNLGQIIPSTARGLGPTGQGINANDPLQSIQGAAQYLRQMYEKGGSWSAAVAGYNLGPGDAAKVGWNPMASRYITGGNRQGPLLVSTAAAADAGPLNNQLADQKALQDRLTQAERDATVVKQKYGAEQELEIKNLQLRRQALEANIPDQEKEAWITQQLTEFKKGLNAQTETNIRITQQQAESIARVSQESRGQAAEIIRLTEVQRAQLQTQQHLGDADKIAAANLALRANQALVAADTQTVAIDRQVASNERLAEASAKGTAEFRRAEIQNQALASTYNVVDQAQAAYNQALINNDKDLIASTQATLDKANALEKERVAKLQSNEAYRETIQANLQIEQTKENTQALELQLSLQGQTSEEIQRRLINLRAEQKIATDFANTNETVRDNIRASAQAYGDMVVKLGEARAAQERWNEEIRSIAETINSTLTSAFDDLFSGKRITDWGDRFKTMLRSIASTVVQSEIIKPLIGSVLGGLSPQLAQSYGTIGGGTGGTGGSGIFGNLLNNLGGIGKLFGIGGSTTTSAAELTGGLFSGGGITGALGGGWGLGGSVGAGGTLGLDTGVLVADAAAGAGAAASEAVVPAVSGISSALGTIGGLLGPIGLIGGLIGGLFGNKKPSNNAGGLLLDLSTGQISDVQGSGNNASVAREIASGISKFEKELLRQIPGAVLPTGQVNIAKGDLTGITTGYVGPLGTINASFSSAQDAVTQFSVAIAKNLANVSDTVKQVLSTISDPSEIQAALAFAKAYDNVETAYDNLFQTIAVDSVRKIGPFETVLNQINDQFDTLTKSAEQYGLSLDPINEGYRVAKDRLAADFNETISRAMQQLQDPTQAAIEEEKRAGEQRVQDAKAVSADLAAVDSYNAANLKKLTDEQAKTAADAAKAAEEFTKSISVTFESALSGIMEQAGPFEQASNRINDNLAKLTEQAVAAGRATDDISATAAGNQQLLTSYFNNNVRQLMQALTDPLQTAIETENRAGQQRVADAIAVSGDLEAVYKYNTANLEKITTAARSAVDTLATAQQVAASAATTLSAAISNITGGGKGQYAQGLETLQQQLAALIAAAQKADPLADLTVIINAFSASLVDLRDAFNSNIRNLTLGISDPYQAAINAEVDAGRRRVQEAQAIGADLAAVDEFNRQNLLAVAKAAATATDAIATAAGFNRDISQQILAIRDPMQAALQAELDAGEKRIAQARQIGADLAQVDELNRLRLLQVADATQASADALDKFTGRLQSLQSALSQLTSGQLSGLTPAQNVAASTANFNRLLAQVQGGNVDLIPELAQAGTTAVQTSQQVYGNAKQTADLRAKVAKALEDVATQTGREALLTAQTVTITASNQAQIKTSLQAQATAARSIADYAAAQADAEFKRTGVENEALRNQANASQVIASQLEAQVNAVSTQTGMQNQITISLQEQLGTQASAARAIAAQLQAQADIEFARTGLKNNIYQQEADGAREIARLLDLQSNAQSLSVEAIKQAANDARAIADQLQSQADADFQRTGVKNLLLQDEANAARQIGINLDKQAQSQGQLSQTDASRVQLAVALLQQDAAVAARTAQQNAGQVPPATANVGTPEQQAAYLAAVQQQAADVAARIAAEQQAAAASEAARQAYEAQQQQQEASTQGQLERILQQQAATNLLSSFIAGDREVGKMLAQLVRIGIVIQDYYSQPYLARGWLQGAYNFVQSWQTSMPFSLSEMLSAQGFASGTSSTPPGWIRVGEQGPEWLYQRGGNTVLPHGVNPPANDDVVAELKRLQDAIAALIRQTQGGQAVASRDAKTIATETASVGRKIGMGVPMRRIVA